MSMDMHIGHNIKPIINQHGQRGTMCCECRCTTGDFTPILNFRDTLIEHSHGVSSHGDSKFNVNKSKKEHSHG